MSILAVVAAPEPFGLRSSPATTTAPSHFLCFHLTAAGVSTSPHIFATYPPPLTLRFGSISSKKWIPFVAREKCVIKEDEEDDGGFWEDPDVGYDDDEIEDDEAREGKRSAISVAASRDSSFSSSSSKSSLALDISDEVELLLSDEERAIWQQNETPDLSKISTKKWNPLHTLALSQQIPVMDKLLEYGMHIDTVDKDGFAALHKAVIGKKEAVISHLLRKGADPHCRDRDGATPLHYAVQVGALQTVKLLIKYKVDVNVADNDGWTPLHIAIQSRSRDIAKVLLVNGADKTRRNKDGKTPLDISLCYGRDFKSYELAKLLKLVPYGVDP